MEAPPVPRVILALLALLGLAATVGCRHAPRHDSLVVALADGRAFVAEIDHPARARGAGVLLLGGGYAHDPGWSVPGTVEADGRTVALTISGEPHTDAPRLAAALTARGFVVMRASTVPMGSTRAAAVGFEEGVELAAAALRALRAQPGVARVYLVGHSLGATRAALIADADVAGIVCLAGAYLSYTADSPARLAAAAGGDPVARTAGVDLDSDGAISGWEAAGATLEPIAAPEFRPGVPWAIDRLRGLGTPVLAIFGGLDPISLHGPAVAGLPRAEVVYLAGLGHQLGEEAAGEEWPRVGPIAPKVVQMVAEWLDARDVNPD